MKNYLFVVIFLFLSSTSWAQENRKTSLFNVDWKFHKGDVQNAETASFNDQDWRKLNLPHDWSIEGPFSEQWASGTGYLPGGVGWYRKTFPVSADQLSKKVVVYFDGVYKNSEVWVNGHYLGKRPSGFTPFEYELTPYLKAGEENVIAVRVDHSKFADARYYTGSGIYRNVYWIEKNPIHIDLWGVGFSTPVVTEANSLAAVEVAIRNTTSSSGSGKVRVSLVDPFGKVVKTAESLWTAPAGQTTKAKLDLPLEQTSLWSIENPNLYNLQVSVFSNDKQVDTYSEQVGFRTIEFDANNGFFLNGKAVKLKGVCIHHDAGALGAAVPKEVWLRRLTKLKELGCNAIRMSHYPHQDYLYELMDQLGFLVQDEAFDEWELGKNKWIKGWNVGTPGKDGSHEEFAEWAERDLRDMVLRNRNRPSIIMWSIGNEIDYPNDPYSHEVLNQGRNPQIFGRGYEPTYPSAARLGEIAERLVQVVKQVDQTRPVTAALAGVVMSNETSYPDALDVVGYNYQEYRYQQDHEQYPNRIIYGSENGKGMDAWLAVDTNEFIASQFLWTGFDFMGEARSWPVRSSGAGLLDLAGFPKTEFYFRQSLWSEEPMVHMVVSKRSEQENTPARRSPAKPSWNWNTGDLLRVRGFSNGDEVELFLNGKSLGKKMRTNSKQENLFWDVTYQAGTLIMKSYKDGIETALTSLKTAAEATKIEATVESSMVNAAGLTLTHIEVDLHDKDGVLVYDAENELHFSIDGPANLLGLESGNLSSHEDYKSSRRKAYHGKLLAYIQSGEKNGKIKVTISAPGLKSKVIEL